MVWNGKVGVSFIGSVVLTDGDGAPETGLEADLIAAVVNPGDTAKSLPAVTESAQEPGVYLFTVPAGFLTVTGNYHVTVRKTTVPLATDHRILTVKASDIDDVKVAADRNADLVESQRGSHSWQGDIWYVDPANGNDANPGTRVLPFATVGAAHTAATDSNHDVIFLLSGGAGLTELDEQLTITKRYLFIRGPGFDFRWKTTANGNVIDVDADGVELSGFRVQTNTTGSGRGVEVDGATFVRLQNIWVERSRGDALRLANCTNCVIQDCLLENVGDTGAGDGIAINGTAGGGSHNHVLRNRVYDTQGDGISIKGATSDHTVVERNHVQGATGYGISVTSDATRTEIDSNHLGDNTLGNILDNGINTSQQNNEQWAKEDLGKLEETRDLTTEAHRYLGLETGTPVVHTPTTIDTTGIAQTVATIGTTVTKTRT